MLNTVIWELRSASPFSPWVIGPVAFLLWVVILFWLKRWSLTAIHRYLARRKSWTWADALIDALSPSIFVMILAIGAGLLQQILPLNPRADHIFGIAFAALVVLALVIFCDRICRRLLMHGALRSPALQGQLGLFEGIVRGVIIGLGVLVFLNTIGVSITPIVASLGIGTVAVALALQDTLANLFAGLYMIAEKPIQAGHFIRLENGEEGYVAKVGWRSTQIRCMRDVVVVVPNSKLAGSVITNLSLPQEALAVTIDVGVDYGCDLDHVERVTVATAVETMAVSSESTREFEPRVRFHTFGDSSINLTVWLGAKDYVSGLTLKHEFIKRLHLRYRHEGIAMPYPIRTIDLPENTIEKLRDVLVAIGDRSTNGKRISPTAAR